MNDVAGMTVRSLVGAAQADPAAACLGSLRAAVRRPVRLELHDDGTFHPGAHEELSARLGPGCMFVDYAEATACVQKRLRGNPRGRRFRDEHIFGPKLLGVPILAGHARAVYVDAKVSGTGRAAFLAMKTAVLGMQPASDCGLALRLASAFHVHSKLHEKSPAPAARLDLTLLDNPLPNRHSQPEGKLA